MVLPQTLINNGKMKGRETKRQNGVRLCETHTIIIANYMRKYKSPAVHFSHISQKASLEAGLKSTEAFLNEYSEEGLA